jgi:hypothetical protein
MQRQEHRWQRSLRDIEGIREVAKKRDVLDEFQGGA